MGSLTLLLILSFVFAAPLRINTPAWYIKQKLGSHVATEHFDIYYDSNVISEQAIEQLINEHEYRYEFVRRQLDTEVSQRIQSFIYPDPETKDWLTGSRNTSVAPVWLSEPQMHMLIDVFDRVFPHELGHVFSREFGLPVINASLSVGLVEGLAVALEPSDGRPTPHEQVLTAVTLATPVNEAIDIEGAIGLASRLSPLGFWTGRGAVSYTTMGSFVQFLAESYGYDQVKAAYAQGDFERVFGKSVEQLVGEWEAYLTNIPRVDRATHAYVTRRFSIPSLFEKQCPHHLPPFERDYRSGLEALAVGDTLVAVEEFERALEKEPAFEDALSSWASLKTMQQEPEEVITRIRQTYFDEDEGGESASEDAAEQPRTSATVWLRLGDALAVAGEPSEAGAAFDSALVRLPLYSFQQRALISLRIKLADNAAVQRINRSSRSANEKVTLLDALDTQDTYVSMLQAVILVLDSQFEPALEYLNRMDEITAEDQAHIDVALLARMMRAHIYHNTNRFQEARDVALVIKEQFEQIGAINSATQYADFADKMSYIVQRSSTQ